MASQPIAIRTSASQAMAFLALSPETRAAVTSTASPVSAIASSSTESLTAKSTRSASTDSNASAASASVSQNKYLRLGHINPGEELIFGSDLVDADE